MQDCFISAQHLTDLNRLLRETDDESMFTDKQHLVARYNHLLETIAQERISGLYLKGITAAKLYNWFPDTKRQLLVDIEALSDRLKAKLQSCGS